MYIYPYASPHNRNYDPFPGSGSSRTKGLAWFKKAVKKRRRSRKLANATKRSQRRSK